MCIGFFNLDLFLPGAASLKDKRRVVRRLKDRLTNRFHLSVAEIDHQELWQRARIGMVMIAGERNLVERTFHAVQDELERLAPGEILEFSMDYLHG